MTTSISTLNYLTTGDIFDKIVKSFEYGGKQIANKLFSKPKPQTPKTPKPYPTPVPNFLDFNFVHEEAPEFISNLNPNGTFIAYSVTPYPDYMKDDKASFEAVFKNITMQLINHRYCRHFLVIRGSTMLTHSASVTSKDRYISFIKDLVKLVYREIYAKRAVTEGIDLSKIESLHEAEQDDQALLSFDFFNPSTLSVVGSFYEIFDKITDDDIENCIFLASHSFVHPMNWFFSPAALALSYFHSQLLFLKKPYKDALHFTKQNLPSVTYLNLTGLYSEVEIDVLHAFSENIQTIIVYDDETGGPTFSQTGDYSSAEDLRIKKKHFSEISDKLLLVPLHNSTSKRTGLKDYSPNDLLYIVENIVLPAIAKFKPTYIVLNCSLFSDASNNTPFLMDSTSVHHIVTILRKACCNKIVIFPFKIPNQKNPTTHALFERVINYAPKNQHDRLRSTTLKYGVPYKLVHMRDIFISMFESLASLKEEPSNWDRLDLMKNFKTNPIMGEVRHRVGKQYKSHSFYKCLYSNIQGVMARTTRNETGFSPSEQMKLRDKLCLYSQTDNTIKVLKLKLLTIGKDIILTPNSQYLVDYLHPREIRIYVFNANACEINSSLALRTHGPRSHLQLYLEFDDTVNQFSIDDHNEINAEEHDIPFFANSGLCKGERFVFQVYGTDIKTNKDTTDIYYYDFEKLIPYKINVPEGVLPRHGVTACAFKKDDTFFLYVFGGKIGAGVTYKGVERGPLDIANIIEVYSTKDPLSGVWDYKILPKEPKKNFPTEKIIPFIPYHGSYAFYSAKKNQILLMGGTLFESSVLTQQFPVLEYNLETNRFDNHRMFLNDAKDNPARPAMQGNEYKRSVTARVIGSYDKDLYYDVKTDQFKFVVGRPGENFVTLYSYNAESQSSDYLDIEIDDEEGRIRIAPPSLNKDINPRGTTEKNVVNVETHDLIEFAYHINDLAAQLAMLYLVEWRDSQTEGMPSETWQPKLEELVANNKMYGEKLALKMKEMEMTAEYRKKCEWQIAEAKRREYGFQRLVDLAKHNKAFYNIITENDSRIERLRGHYRGRYLLSRVVERKNRRYNMYLESFLRNELENVNEKKKEDIFQTYEETYQKKTFNKLDVSTKRKVCDLLDEIIKTFQEPRPANMEVSFQLTDVESPADPKVPSPLVALASSINPKQNYQEVFLADRSISFSQMCGFLELRPLLYQLPSSIFVEDFVKKAIAQEKGYGKLLKDLESFTKEVISATTSISNVVGGDSSVPEESDKELKATLSIFFEATTNIIKKLLKRVRKSLMYGNFVPTPYVLRFELFVILLRRLRNDLEDGGKFKEDIFADRNPASAQAEESSIIGSGRRKEKAGAGAEALIANIDGNKSLITAMPVARVQEEEGKREGLRVEEVNVRKSGNGCLCNEALKRSVIFSKVACTSTDQGTQVDGRELPPVLEDDLRDSVEESRDLKVYQENLGIPYPNKVIFNTCRSELLVMAEENGGFKIRRLRFKIFVKGSDGTKGRFEEISFECSPCSIALYGSNLVAYIDPELKLRHPEVYRSYKSCLIFADLRTTLDSLAQTNEVGELIFRKMFSVGQDDHLLGRCLLVTEESLFLLGGRSLKFKGKPSVRKHDDVLRYITKGMENVPSNSSLFKDAQTDELSEKAEVVATCVANKIFIASRFGPARIEVFTKSGDSTERLIDIPHPDSLKGYCVRMNLVNFRGKEEILLSYFCREKDIRFMLFDCESETFEEEIVTLQNEGEEKLSFFYTGFEELETTIGVSRTQQILFYSFRGETPEIFRCEIQVAKETTEEKVKKN